MDSEVLVAKPACSKQISQRSHLIQHIHHIPCLEARSANTNEVDDWKMVGGWLYCTPIDMALACCQK